MSEEAWKKIEKIDFCEVYNSFPHEMDTYDDELRVQEMISHVLKSVKKALTLPSLINKNSQEKSSRVEKLDEMPDYETANEVDVHNDSQGIHSLDTSELHSNQKKEDKIKWYH